MEKDVHYADIYSSSTGALISTPATALAAADDTHPPRFTMIVLSSSRDPTGRETQIFGFIHEGI